MIRQDKFIRWVMFLFAKYLLLYNFKNYLFIHLLIFKICNWYMTYSKAYLIAVSPYAITFFMSLITFLFLSILYLQYKILLYKGIYAIYIIIRFNYLSKIICDSILPVNPFILNMKLGSCLTKTLSKFKRLILPFIHCRLTNNFFRPN